MTRLPCVWCCVLLTVLDADVRADTNSALDDGSGSVGSTSDLTRPDVAPNPSVANRPETDLPELASPPVSTPAIAAIDSASRPEQGRHWSPVIIEPLSLFVIMRGMEAYWWPNPFSLRRTNEWSRHYREAFTMPPKFDRHRSFMQWDGDRWEINVIGHGLLGSELYLRPRRCGMGWLGSFAIAAGASTIWEYGIEANGVRPSAVDLVYTPLSGILFGEVRFQAWRAADAIGNRAWRTLLRGVFDPVGEFDTSLLNAPC